MDHYYKDDYIENIINEYDENNDTEDGIDSENESNEDDVFRRLNDFISDHLDVVIPCILVFMIIILVAPFTVTAYFSREKYLETKSDTTLAYTIVDKSITISGIGYDISTHYHIVVKDPETGAK